MKSNMDIDMTPHTPYSSSPISKLLINTSSTASTTLPEHEEIQRSNVVETKYPWPKGSYKELPTYSEEIKKKLYTTTDLFFYNNGIRILKYNLPLKLPEGFRDLEDIAAQGKEKPPYTSVYRHMSNLKLRILNNWSYIETDRNNAKENRNLNMPFDLRPMTSQISTQLDMMAKDLNDPDFTGVLLTLNSCLFMQCGFPKKQGLSKVIGGALVEGLVTNDRCIKAIWLHPQLSPRSSRLILQAFIPRVMVESFDIVVEADPEAPPFKFVYAMHDDLDRWPRQSWLLMASSKKMSLSRHYEPSLSSAYPVDLDFDAHMDEGVALHQQACQCQLEKAKKNAKAQGWLERLIGCTEQQMYSLAPSREDKIKYGITNNKLGWIDLIPKELDSAIIEDLKLLLLSHTKKVEEENQPDIKFNYDSDEWCGLNRDDLIDISSDSEISSGPTKRSPPSGKAHPRSKKIKLKSPRDSPSEVAA